MDDREPNPKINLEEHLIQVAQREDALAAEIKEKLPDFVKECEGDAGTIILHQDSFAADYSDDELRLLGMAIKYAGLSGKTIHVIGSNRETIHLQHPERA